MCQTTPDFDELGYTYLALGSGHALIDLLSLAALSFPKPP